MRLPSTPRPHGIARLLKLSALGALALLAGCASLTGHPKANANGVATVPQGPSGDSFYSPPAPLPAGHHGDIIWARRLTNGAALPDAAQNWLVLYRSTDVAGHPVAVSGTVAIPKGKPPRGGWPVISWTHGTTGMADICAPSMDGPDYTDRGYVDQMNAALDKWVQKGYAVLKTDYQGLGTPGAHPYLVASSEARGATDIVLAARQLDPQLSRNWLVMGHSQGGQAAAYTAYLGPLYAQNLNLAGAIAVSPASNLAVQMKYIETHPDMPGNAFTPLILASMAASAPGVQLDKLLTEEGQKRIHLVEQVCLGGLRGPGGWSLTNKDLVNMNADFSAFNGALSTLSGVENVRPTVPLLVLQAKQDHVVLKPFTDMMVARFKTLGVDVQYNLYDINGKPPSVHRATVARSLPDAMAWAEQHLPSGH